MNTSSTDRIERKIVLKATRARVWRALTNIDEFNGWFGVRLSGKQFYEIATLLGVMQKTTGCWLIVNDRVDVAAAVGARGIQLASHSMGIRDSLRVSGLPVGASIHSVDEAIDAEQSGAAWCVAGTVFETPSHAGRMPARIEL